MSKKNSRFTTNNRPAKEIVKLSGEAINVKGARSKSRYFDFLNLDFDDYSDLEFTPNEASRISAHLRKLTTGSTAAIPLWCGGKSACPFANFCPLAQIDRAPIGKKCLIESQLIKEFIMRTIDEYDIDPSNFTEISFANELAEIEILLMRLNYNLAKPENPELVIDQTVGVDRESNPIIQKQLSPFMEQKEKLYARRSKIIKLMVGDRQEKYKKEAALKITSDNNPSSRMAAMRQKLDALSRQMNNIDKSDEGNYLSPQDLIDEDD